MIKYCDIKVAGAELAPYSWQNTVNNSTYRMIYIYSGVGGYWLGKSQIPFKTGFLYLLPACANIATYSSYENDELRLNHGYANFELIPPIISNDVLEIDPNDDPSVRYAVEVFNSLCAKCYRLDINLNEDELNYLKSTVVFLIETMVKKTDAFMVKDEAVISALQIMHSELRNKVTIADIAKRCYLSPEALTQKFIKYLGEPPYSYFKKLKIRTALQLCGCGMKLDAVAAECGYSDASALLHAIKKLK